MLREPREKDIQNSILDYLHFWMAANNHKGFFWTNNNVGIYDPASGVYRKNKSPHSIKGVSDILGLLNGRFIAIEVKSRLGKLTPEQRIFIDKINVSGGLAFVARSINDVERGLSNGKESEEECESKSEEEK